MIMMFNNKVLINLIVCSMGKNYDLYIPINEKVGNITKLLNNTLFYDSINESKNNTFINALTGEVYDNNTLVRDIDIKNESKIILF